MRQGQLRGGPRGGKQVIATLPEIRLSVRAQRAFPGRAVHYLATEAGIRQFFDIGTGLPSANNTHEVAQRVAPQSRVAYVDNDRCKSGCAHSHGLFMLPEMNAGVNALRASLSAQRSTAV